MLLQMVHINPDCPHHAKLSILIWMVHINPDGPYLYSDQGLGSIVSSTSDGGRIHVNLLAVRLTSTLHFDQHGASYLFRPTSFVHVLFSLLIFL